MTLPHLRRLLPALARHRRRLALGVLALLATTALSVATPWVLRHAIDDLAAAVTREKLRLYAGAILGLVAVEGVFRYLMRMVLIGVSREMEYELRNDVFRHLTLLAPRYYQHSRIGEVMSRATNDMSAVRMVLGPGIMYTASTAATFAGAVTLMVAISPRLTLLALVPLVLVSWLVRHYGRQVHDRYEEVQAQLAEMNALVQENLAGARVVRAYAQEPHEEARFAAANEEYVSRNRRLVRITGILHPGIGFLMGLGSLAVLWLGGRMVVAGEVTLGQFVAFGAYLAMLHWPMIALGWVVNLVERGEASMGRIHAILDAPAEIRDEDPLPVAAVRGDVEMRSLSLRYDGQPVLLDIDLHVPAGTTVAIVGPTGSGKSTLVSLLPRLVDPRRGPSSWTATTCAASRSPPCAARSASCPRRASSSRPPCARTWPSAWERAGGPAPGGAGGDGRVEWAAGVAQLEKDLRDFPHGLRDGGRRARDHAVGGAEAARRARPRPRHRPAYPRPRRRAVRGGHRDRGGDPRGAARGDARAHHLPRLAPGLDGEGGRPHRRPAGGADRRARHPRGARGPGRLLRRPPPAAAARAGDRDRRGRGVSAPDDDPACRRATTGGSCSACSATCGRTAPRWGRRFA
jgi:ABC-type transport system involved in cytochrome bd biosynthesis fused ATPase/permease subunit